MKFDELIKERYSYRKFKDTPVAKEKIETLCKNVDDMKKRLDANCSNYKVINEIVVCLIRKTASLFGI